MTPAPLIHRTACVVYRLGTATAGGICTHARVVTNDIKPGKLVEWIALVTGSVVPALKEQSGFRGFVMLVDREAEKSIGYGVWNSESDMIASETSGNYHEQIGKLGSVLAGPPARAAYEVISVE